MNFEGTKTTNKQRSLYENGKELITKCACGISDTRDNEFAHLKETYRHLHENVRPMRKAGTLLVLIKIEYDIMLSS